MDCPRPAGARSRNRNRIALDFAARGFIVTGLDIGPELLEVERRIAAKVIADRSHHGKAPHVRFIHQDFTDPLPLREGSFDLLPALCAPGVARAMARYLCVGGLLATDRRGRR